MDLGGRRWMMRMRDAEENFSQLQNARLYIADVQAAEIARFSSETIK